MRIITFQPVKDSLPVIALSLTWHIFDGKVLKNVTVHWVATSIIANKHECALIWLCDYHSSNWPSIANCACARHPQMCRPLRTMMHCLGSAFAAWAKYRCDTPCLGDTDSPGVHIATLWVDVCHRGCWVPWCKVVSTLKSFHYTDHWLLLWHLIANPVLLIAAECLEKKIGCNSGSILH